MFSLLDIQLDYKGMDTFQKPTALIEKAPNLDSVVVVSECRVEFHHTLVDLASVCRDKSL